MLPKINALSIERDREIGVYRLSLNSYFLQNIGGGREEYRQKLQADIMELKNSDMVYGAQVLWIYLNIIRNTNDAGFVKYLIGRINDSKLCTPYFNEQYQQYLTEISFRSKDR
jgi:hypothetical protein